MKKFTEFVSALHEAETSSKSELQKSYTEYVSAKLNKFGAKSPAELTLEQKNEFFSEISKDWERGVSTKVVNESKEVNEDKEIKSDSEFKEYAQTVLKKAFGDKYDEEKAMKTAEGILKKCDGDYGACVGMLTSGLGESKDVKETETPIGMLNRLNPNKSLKVGDITTFSSGKYKGKKVKIVKDLGDGRFELEIVGESKDVNEAKCSMCGNKECECYKEKNANESVNSLNEEEVYVADAKFKDEAALKADIAKNIAPAFNKLLKDNGINFPPVTVKESRGRYEFESKPATGKDLGIMQYGFKEVYINSFGGGSLPKISKATKEDSSDFQFTPLIWFNLHYSYIHGSADTSSQGSNGCSLYLPGEDSSNIFYDIVKGKFLKQSEAERK
jgi:hypothetical protein